MTVRARTKLLVATLMLLAPASASAAGPASSSSSSTSARAGSFGIGPLRVFSGVTTQSTQTSGGSTTTTTRQSWGVAYVPKGAVGSASAKGLVRTNFAIESRASNGQTSSIEGRANVVGGKTRTAWGGNPNGGFARGVVTSTRGTTTSTWNAGNSRLAEYNRGTVTTEKGQTRSSVTYTKVHPSGATKSMTTKTAPSGVTTTTTRLGTPAGQFTTSSTVSVAARTEAKP